MSPNSTPPSTTEIRSAIMRYAPHDALRVVAMWLVPLIFMLFNPWARHWGTALAFVVVGTFVIGGTTSSLPDTAFLDLPPESAEVWTPLRCGIFVGLLLALWTVTFVAVT